MGVYTNEVKRRMLKQEIKQIEENIERYDDILKNCSVMTRRTHTRDLAQWKQSLSSKRYMLDNLKGD